MTKTTSRIVVCADAFFPYGDAASNRIKHLLFCFRDNGFETVVFGREDATIDGKKEGEIEGVKFYNIENKTGGVLGKIEKAIFRGQMIVEKLKEHKISNNDIVIIYAANSIFVNTIIKYCKNNKIKCYLDVVEWHQPFQYKKGKMSIEYNIMNRTFTKLAFRVDGVLAISKMIQDYYIKRGQKSRFFPPMVDTNIINKEDKETVRKDYVNLIYPGRPFQKDDMETMLEGLKKCESHIKRKIHFHLTGFSIKELQDYLGGKKKLIEELSDVLFIHGWMNHEQLIKLYNDMDYVYLSRPNNLVTQANFPSKIPELMCRGIVPICNKVGDYWTFFTDGEDSILFNNNTSNDCSNAIERACNVSEKELQVMKNKAIECAERCFDYTKWSKDLLEFVVLGE